MENPFQRTSHALPHMQTNPNRSYFKGSSSFQYSYTNELKIPNSLRKNYDQQYSYSSRPVSTQAYPFAQTNNNGPLINRNFNVNKKVNENPFYRKHLCIPGVQISMIHPYGTQSNQQLYALMDAKNLPIESFSYYGSPYYRNEFTLSDGSSKISPYFDQYKLSKLRQETEKNDKQKLNQSIGVLQQHYPSHIMNPNATNNNQILRNMFDTMLKKQPEGVYSTTSVDTTKAKGMFAGIYTKMREHAPSPILQENTSQFHPSVSSQRTSRKQTDLFGELFQKVQERVNNQQWQETEEQKLLKAKSLFAEVYAKMKSQKRTQQLMKKSMPFKDLYQMHRASSNTQQKIDNEQAIKARAIFGQVYAKMHEAAYNTKENGVRDEQNLTKAKRMFGQVFERINYSLKPISGQVQIKEQSTPKERTYNKLNQQQDYHTNSYKPPNSDENRFSREERNRYSGQFGQQNRGSGTYSPAILREPMAIDEKNFQSQKLKYGVDIQSGHFKVRQIENVQSQKVVPSLSQRRNLYPQKIEFRNKDYQMIY